MQVFVPAQVAFIKRGLTELLQHLRNYRNPHRVTAAQVGAYTEAEVDALVAANGGFAYEVVAETVTIPAGRQMAVFNGIYVDAQLNVDGSLILEP